MSAKIILVLCAQVLLIQSALSCGSCGWGRGLGLGGFGGYGGLGGYGGYGGAGCGLRASGGGLPISSASPAPAGLAVHSKNNIAGCLRAGGTLPFIATVGVEGTLPTRGSAGTDYHCGGNTGIRPAGGYGGYGAGYGIGHGAGWGLGGCGCGCGGGWGGY